MNHFFFLQLRILSIVVLALYYSVIHCSVNICKKLFNRKFVILMPPKYLIDSTKFILLFNEEMDFDSIKTAIFSSTITESDPFKDSKKLQLNLWCNAFSLLFSDGVQERLPFILDILSEADCWEETNTIHRVKLNRRMVAKKLVQTHSKSGIINPLSDFERYQVACWCCLEEDTAVLFEKIKQNNKAESADALRNLVKLLSTRHCSEPLVGFWSHIVGGFASELRLEGMNLYEYGLHYALFQYRLHVESVEFFLTKIKSLSEDELSAMRKLEILMNTTVRASKTPVGTYPEIFEFCLSQLSPDDYPAFLKKDSGSTRDYNSFVVLVDLWRFDEMRKLLELIGPNDFSERGYESLLRSLNVTNYPEVFADEAVKIFKYIWMKEGFSRHRNMILRLELTVPGKRGCLLIPLLEKNYMEAVWAIFDKACPEELMEFMKSEQANYMRSILEERKDLYLLNKFLSYAHPTRGLNDESASNVEMDVDNSSMEVVPEVKRLKKD